MVLTPEQKAAQNRINAQASTGPKTPFGKAAAARNSFRHGLRAEALALPVEDQEELRRLTDEWLEAYRPETPGRRALLDRAVSATLQFHRGARFQHAALERQVNAAVEDWEHQQQEQVAALAATLAADPAAAVRGLRRTAAGCRWLLARWRHLRSVLERDGCWYAPTHRDEAIRLLGKRSEDLKDADVYWLRLVNLSAHPAPGEAALAWYLVPGRVPDVLRRILDGGYPDHEHSVGELREIVAEELAALEEREARLRITIEEPERAGAADRALLLSGEEGARWLRYERMHDGAFHRAYKALLKGEEESDCAASSAASDQAEETSPPLLPAEAPPPQEADAPAVAPAEAPILGVGSSVPDVPDVPVAGPTPVRAHPAPDETPEKTAAPDEATIVGDGPALPDVAFAGAAARPGPSGGRTPAFAPSEATIVGDGPALPDLAITGPPSGRERSPRGVHPGGKVPIEADPDPPAAHDAARPCGPLPARSEIVDPACTAGAMMDVAPVG